MSAGRVLAACVVLCCAARAPRAQDDETGFARLFARAEQVRAAKDAEPKAVRDAYAAALAEFLRLPAGDEQRVRRAADGAFAAWLAGDARLAPALYADAWRTAKHSDALAEQRLRALLDSGQAEAAIEFAKEVDGEHHAVTSRFLSGAGRGGDPRLLDAADTMLKSGRLELGLWAFEQAALGSPGVAVAWANWGLSLRHAGRSEACEKAYRKAVELAPSDSMLWNDFALFLKGTGRLEEAAGALERGRSLEDPPGSSPAIPNLLQLERRLGKRLVADGDAAISTVLSLRPEAAFPRRIAIDRMLDGLRRDRR